MIQPELFRLLVKLLSSYKETILRTYILFKAFVKQIGYESIFTEKVMNMKTFMVFHCVMVF